MTNRKTPPSRIKYDKNHPTVSARLPIDKRNRLLSMCQSMDVTLSELLLHFIGEYEPKIIPIEEAYKKGLREGNTRGFLETKHKYGVKYPCGKCGKEIFVTTESEKKAIRQFMLDNGWGHQDCPDQQ